jgi:hypothetical protein
MSWEEEEEQTLVANNCSRLMKTGFLVNELSVAE